VMLEGSAVSTPCVTAAPCYLEYCSKSNTRHVIQGNTRTAELHGMDLFTLILGYELFSLSKTIV